MISRGSRARTNALRKRPPGGRQTTPPPLAAPAELIPIGKIVEDKHNHRRSFDAAELAELSASIKALGIVEPLVAFPRDNGTYWLLSGHRRLRAARLAGKTHVPLHVIAMPETFGQRQTMSLVANLQRVNLNPIDLANGLEHVRHTMSITRKELGKLIGKSETWISETMSPLNLTQEETEILAEVEPPPSKRSIAEITRTADPEARRELVGKVAKGASTREVRKNGRPKDPVFIEVPPADFDDRLMGKILNEKILSEKPAEPAAAEPNLRHVGRLTITQASAVNALLDWLAHALGVKLRDWDADDDVPTSETARECLALLLDAASASLSAGSNGAQVRKLWPKLEAQLGKGK